MLLFAALDYYCYFCTTTLIIIIMAYHKNAMEAYIQEIGTNSLLTDQKERELAERISGGDKDALGELVTANLKFVLAVANSYKGQGVDYDDLVSEGNIGLMKAASQYSPYPGKRFVKFAAPIIKGCIENYIKQHSGLYKVPQAEATKAEIRRSHPVSVDAPIPVGSKNNFNLLNLLENANSPYADSHFEAQDEVENLQRMLTVLNDRERQVITLVYGVGQERHTMAEAAAIMQIKRERVRQIRDKALRKLKHFKPL